MLSLAFHVLLDGSINWLGQACLSGVSTLLIKSDCFNVSVENCLLAYVEILDYSVSQ